MIIVGFICLSTGSQHEPVSCVLNTGSCSYLDSILYIYTIHLYILFSNYLSCVSIIFVQIIILAYPVSAFSFIKPMLTSGKCWNELPKTASHCKGVWTVSGYCWLSSLNLKRNVIEKLIVDWQPCDIFLITFLFYCQTGGDLWSDRHGWNTVLFIKMRIFKNVSLIKMQ